MNFVQTHADDCVAVIYHTNFPYPFDPFYDHNVEDNEGRRSDYGIGGVPHVRVDGSQSGTSSGALQAAYDARKATPTDVGLIVEGSWDDETRQVEVTVTASTMSPLLGEYSLHIVLIENEVYFEGTNGIDWHEFTMRDMFPDFGGTPVTFSGDFPQEAQASASFVLPTGAPPHEYVAGNCQLVFFLQELAGTRSENEVHQAAVIGVTELGGTAVAEAAPSNFRLGANYPNPFNPTTTIPVTAEKDGPARLEILDATGRRVRTLHDGPLAAGTRDFRWDGRDDSGRRLASGVYLARLVGSLDQQSRRLVLLQ